MKKKYILFTAHLFLIMGIISCFSFSAHARRNRERAVRGSSIKAVDRNLSVGLQTKSSTIICAYPGDPTCIGTQIFSCPPEQQKDSDDNCVCIDPTMTIDPTDKTKCILKKSEVIVTIRRNCGNTLIKAVSSACNESHTNGGMGGYNNEEYKCYDPNELYALFDTRDLYIFADGQSYEYDNVCSAYTEDFMKSIATDYEVSGANSPACKIQRAIADATSECFALVLSTGKATGATQAIRGNLKNTCGAPGILQKYEKLFGVPPPSGIHFPTNLPELFISAGRTSMADGLELVGKALDGRLTDKTDSWERDITVIANTQLSKVATHCGQEYATTTHNEDIQLTSDKSSLQRLRDEKGLLAGSQEWALNQASVFIGENQVNKLKREGIIGGITDEEVAMGKMDVITVENFTPKIIKEKLEEEDKLSATYLFITERSGADDNDNTSKGKDQFKIIEAKIDGATINLTYRPYDGMSENSIPIDAYKAMMNRQENTDEITE